MTDPIKASSPRWAYLPFRISVTIATLMLFDQAIFAGQFLSGTFGALQTHRDNATVAGLTVLFVAGCAVLIRRPGRGPIWPVFASLGLFALIALPIALGFARALPVHIPLGVSIIILAVLLTLWAWRARPPRPPASESGDCASAADDAAVRL
jgi:hypothetical protein